ncbi:MAG: hypothetical protein HOO67_07580 [Candidatus Peribacteraceae bacterium]|nr:hypothetical protein [Candidatus Peribacteraceae bacterium]
MSSKILTHVGIAACLSLLLTGCTTAEPSNRPEGMTSSVAATTNPVITTPMWWDTSSWKPYESKKFRFTVNLPPSYVVTETENGIDIKDSTQGTFTSMHVTATKNTIAAELGKHFDIGTKVQWETFNNSANVMTIKYKYFTADAYSKSIRYLLMRNVITEPAMPQQSLDMLDIKIEASAPFRGDDAMNFDTALSEPEYALLTSFRFTDFPQ